VSVAQRHTGTRQGGHGRRGGVVDNTEPQAVGDEQNDIMGPRQRLGGGRGCQDDGQGGDAKQRRNAHAKPSVW
jgi:hypothetical protein